MGPVPSRHLIGLGEDIGQQRRTNRHGNSVWRKRSFFAALCLARLPSVG